MPFLRSLQFTADDQLNRSLTRVLVSAVPGTIFFSTIQGSAYAAFVRALSKQDSLYGLLAALPLISGLFRFASAYLIEKLHARRRIFLTAFYLQRFSWIPFALIPYLIPGTRSDLRVALAILCLSMHVLGGAFGEVAFVSWLTDLIPLDIRGNFLGLRNRLAQAAAVLTPLLVGWYLDRRHGFPGLSTVLLTAALFGALDIFLWHPVHHPSMAGADAPLGFPAMLIVPLRLPAYRKLLAFWTSALFSFGFLGPFVMVYNLEVLRLSYTQVSFQLQVLPGIVAFLLAGTLGRSIDRYGSKPLLWLCMIVSTTAPIIWFLSTPAWPWMQTFTNFFGGITWVGLDMAQMSLMMRILPRENRSVYIAGYGVTAWLLGNAVAMMLAGLIADWIRPWVERCGITIFGTPLVVYQVLFLISFVLRVLVLAVTLPRVEEPGAGSANELLASFYRQRRRESARSL